MQPPCRSERLLAFVKRCKSEPVEKSDCFGESFPTYNNAAGKDGFTCSLRLCCRNFPGWWEWLFSTFFRLLPDCHRPQPVCPRLDREKDGTAARSCGSQPCFDEQIIPPLGKLCSSFMQSRNILSVEGRQRYCRCHRRCSRAGTSQDNGRTVHVDFRESFFLQSPGCGAVQWGSTIRPIHLPYAHPGGFHNIHPFFLLCGYVCSPFSIFSTAVKQCCMGTSIP